MGEKDHHILFDLAGHDSILGHRGIHFKKSY